MEHKLSKLYAGEILTYSDGAYMYVVNVNFSGSAKTPLSYLVKRQSVGDLLKNNQKWEILLEWTSDFELVEEKVSTIFPINDWVSKEDVLPVKTMADGAICYLCKRWFPVGNDGWLIEHTDGRKTTTNSGLGNLVCRGDRPDPHEITKGFHVHTEYTDGLST